MSQVANQKRAYTAQRLRAQARNIDWQFTFESWLAWWGDDYQYRGRTRGCLVMARPGDQGAYSPDNCVKITAEENVSQAQSGKILNQHQRDILKKQAGRKSPEAYRRSAEKQRGKIKHTASSKEKVAQARRRRINTPWGLFNSVKEAAAYKNISPQCLNGWIRRQPERYQYI